MNRLELIKVEKKIFPDRRGHFGEIYSRRDYSKLGIDCEFVQDNNSLSIAAGTLRGLHFQSPPFAQAKLVWCVRGGIFDVAVDLRKGSATFGNWVGHELTAQNRHQLFVPIGFAHGFVTLEPNTEIVYKCSDYYQPEAEGAIRWDTCGIEWPLSSKPILSEKDNDALSFAEFDSPFIYGENS